MTPFSNSRFACLCLLLLGAAESTSAAPLDPEQLKAIDSTVETAVLAKSLPGAALAIVVDGKVVAARTYGSRDVEAKAPVTKATVFRLGSISKFVTAAAIMRLVERGQLRLTDKAAAHLNGRPNVPEELGEVTIQQLLNHTSGLPDLTPKELGELVSRDAPIGDEHVVTALHQVAPSAPGTTWSYNNIGYRLLSWILEDATGVRFNEYIVRDLAPALKLYSLQPCDLARPKVASGYISSDGKYAADPSYAVKGLLGDGGLCANVEDLALLPTRLLESNWIAAPTLSAMIRPTTLQYGTIVDYGLGVRRGLIGDLPMWGHSGSGLAGGWAALAHYPDRRMTIAVVGNGSGGPDDAITLQAKLAAILLNEDDLRNNEVENSIRRLLPLAFEGNDARVCYAWGTSGVTRRLAGSSAAARAMLYQGNGVFARADYPLDRYALQIENGRPLAHRVYYDGYFAELLRPSSSRTC